MRFVPIVTACTLLCGAAATASAKDAGSDDVFEKVLGHNPFLKMRTDELRYEVDDWRARIARDGSVKLEWIVRFDIFGIPGSVTLDGGGKDHYKAQKDFFERTRRMRFEMARVARAIDIRDALAELPDRLRAIWTDPRRTRERNKREIFMEWLDTNGERDSGLRARRLIERFIASELAGVFTPEEIDRFNRGHVRRFDPYGDAPAEKAGVASWVE